MMTDLKVHESPVDAGRGPGERLLRLRQRRKLVREEILALLVLFVALAITVAVLAMQWLGSTATDPSAVAVPLKLVATFLGGST
jgi:hypothetical protein